MKINGSLQNVKYNSICTSENDGINIAMIK